MFNDTPLDQMDGRYAKSMEGISPLNYQSVFLCGNLSC